MICVGNWKLHKNPQEARVFIQHLRRESTAAEQGNLVVLPPMVCLSSVSEELKGSAIRFGAQNCHSQLSGAFTGENSIQVVADLGGSFCLVGHSERRQLFAETNQEIARKISVFQSHAITPIFCIGETLKERETGMTVQVLSQQLEQGLSEVNELRPLWLAYEPVWAIGTGRVASVEQVQETHQFIRTWLENHRPQLKSRTLLYGGSVKPENAGQLAALPNVDGFLIGGASLQVESFLGILRAKAN